MPADNFTLVGRKTEPNPQDARSHYNRDPAQEGSSESEQTLAILNKSIDLNPQDVHAYYNRGLAYGHLGKHEKALADFNMACAYARMGDAAQACDWLARAIELNAENAADARSDPDLDGIRDDARFRALVGDNEV